MPNPRWSAPAFTGHAPILPGQPGYFPKVEDKPEELCLSGCGHVAYDCTCEPTEVFDNIFGRTIEPYDR